MHLSTNKAGLAVGSLLAALHILWAILVLFGWAQGWVDFAEYAHMVHANVLVGQFDFGAALIAILISFGIGYVVGAIFARGWNRMTKSK